MKHKTHNVLNAAYMFYYASDVISSPGGSADDAAAHEIKSRQKLGERLNELVADLLVVAKNVRAASRTDSSGHVDHQAGFDVLNALTMSDNNMFLNEQKVRAGVARCHGLANKQFGPGDGFLVSLHARSENLQLTLLSSCFLFTEL